MFVFVKYKLFTIDKIPAIEDNTLISENATFGVLINGDSMKPQFEDGQHGCCSRILRKSGDIGIFVLNQDGYIKKLEDDEKGVFLISLDKKYAPIPVSSDDRLDIFGKVIGKSSASELPGYHG